MKQSIYEIAASASRALKRKPRTGVPVKVVAAECEICGKTHRMGLGSPRCVTAAPVGSSVISRPEVAIHLNIFGKAIAMAMLCGCMSFSGCARSPYYVSGVSVGANVTSDGKEITAGLSFAPNPYAYKSVTPLYSK
jgi:hypothetical protein